MAQNNDTQPKTIPLGIYRHGKTSKLYEVLGIALQTETNESLVIYRPQYDSEFELFARPYNMFVEDVEIDGQMVPRFKRVK